MRRSGLAVSAAVMLSMIPAAPPALAASFPLSSPAWSADSGDLLMEVSHRKKRRHCHRDVRSHGGGWHYHGGDNCRPRFVRRDHHRHNDGGACIRIGDITICF